MFKQIASVLLAGVIAGGVVGCASTEESGPVETASANAGRVVDDSVITAKVKSALVADPTTKAYQISVETYQGTVQLSGFVEKPDERSRAGEIAKDVEGVQNVKNSLQVRSGG